jgi:hypothetical protein
MTDKPAFALHQFATVFIFQTTEDVTLRDGRVIPKGYVNATQMCVANNKRIDNWIQNNKTTLLLQAFESDTSNSRYPVLIPIKGGDSDTQGTWISYDLAILLAQWLSPEFAVWSAKTLRLVIEGDFKALTVEAEEAQKKLVEIWERLRKVSKESFWFITDAVKSYYIKYPKPEHYAGEHYAQVFDVLNVGLFGKKAKQIKEELGIPKGKLNRDNFGEKSLQKIDMIQRIAEAQIIHHEKQPLEAVQTALLVMNYSVSSYKD